jgi:hypothetical protein
LIERVENRRYEEDGPQVLPSAADQLPPAICIDERGPKIGRPAGSGVRNPGACGQYGRDEGLEYESEIERAARAGDKVGPSAADRIDDETHLTIGHVAVTRLLNSLNAQRESLVPKCGGIVFANAGAYSALQSRYPPLLCSDV